MPKAKDYCLKLQKNLISRFKLQNGTFITPLLLFYLQLGLLLQKDTILFSTLQKKASTVLWIQQWTQEGKVKKIQTEVSSQKQWSF